MEAVGSYILIKIIEEENKRKSGFITEDSSRYKKASVVKKGGLVNSVDIEDVIYYDKTQGHDLIINEKKYRIITERDVVVIV